MSDPLKVEAQLNRALISRQDFKEAEDYLKAYPDDMPETFKRALLVAAIVAYARPFTSNGGRLKQLATATLSGNPRQILGDEEYLLHQLIIELRNEAITHSDYDRRPTRIMESTPSWFLTKSRFFDVLAERLALPTFLSACTKMARHCEDRMFDLNRKLAKAQPQAQQDETTSSRGGSW